MRAVMRCVSARLLPDRAFDERGGIPVFVAILTIPMLMLMGILVIDGGGKLRATERADAAAREAARAGGQAIDAGKAVEGEGIVAQPDDARAAAQSYLRNAGLRGTVTVAGNGQRISVTVHDTYVLRFIPLMGPMQVTGQGSATLLYGVTGPSN